MSKKEQLVMASQIKPGDEICRRIDDHRYWIKVLDCYIEKRTVHIITKVTEDGTKFGGTRRFHEDVLVR